MIDIHTHLLPGVDDGSPRVDRSVPVLSAWAKSGVEVVVCTPHLDASRATEAPFEKHARILEDLVAHAPAGVELLPGWEIMLDTPGADLTDPRLSLGRSTAVLVEFPRHGLPPNASAELFRIRMSGKVPVVAHPERYHGCTADTVADWRGAGAVIQVDVDAVLRNPKRRDLALQLLREGLVDMFASDNHGDKRALAPAREWLLEVGTQEHADLLTRTNAKRLLADEPMLPVPPLVMSEGFVGMLRSLLGRRS